MSKKFLPLAGIAVVLAVMSYLLLSFLFPHKQAEVVDTSIKADAVFSAQLNEAEAQPTATTAEQADPGSQTEVPATGETAAAESTAVDESGLEVPVAAAESSTGTDTAVEVSAETPATELASEPAAEATPANEPAALETSAAEPAPSSGSGLSREQLARIVAEAAAKAAAETAKSIAEQAARDAAGG